MKRLWFAALVVLLAGGVAFAGNVNRERGLNPGETCITEIDRCDPETDASSTDGWDKTPPGGSWGGKSTSKFAVAWEEGMLDVPTNPGRLAQCTIPGATGRTPTKIKINYLAGLANDDFCVLATVAGNNFVFLGCVDEDNNVGEQWRDVEFDLLGLGSSGQDVTVKIIVTGNQWSGFDTWGQVAIDYIAVWGDGG
jgi:hypothetical protein